MTEVYREGGFNVCVENGMINISQEFDDEEEEEDYTEEVVVIDDDDEEEEEKEAEEDEKGEEVEGEKVEERGVEENAEGQKESEDYVVGDEEDEKEEEGGEVENGEEQKESEDDAVNVVGGGEEEEHGGGEDDDDDQSVEELSMKDVILVGDDDWSNDDDCKRKEYDSADEEEFIWRKYSAIEQANTNNSQTSSTIFTTPVICSQSRPTAHEQSEPNETILRQILVTETPPFCPMRSILKNNIDQEVNRSTGSNLLLRDRMSIKRRSRLVEEETEEEQHLRTAARRRSSKRKSESMEQVNRKQHQRRPERPIKPKVVEGDQSWVEPNPKRWREGERLIHHNILERNRRKELAFLFDRLRQTVDYVAQVNDTEWPHHHMRDRNWRSKVATLKSAVDSIRNLEEQGKKLERERNAQRRLNSKLMKQRNVLRDLNAKLMKYLTTQSSSSFKNHHDVDYSTEDDDDDED